MTSGYKPPAAGATSEGDRLTSEVEFMTDGYCDGCGRRALLTPLHGPEKGGPLRCYVCAGAWHAEHGRRRKMGRVVIRAIKAFVDGGGSPSDVDKLVPTAHGRSLGLGFDPLGYMAETAATADETVLLTSEVLSEALRLVHPDAHPPERRDLANRVTRQLLALQPFVFPAVVPKPVAPYQPPASDGSLNVSREPFKETSRPRYPCVDCAPTIPLNYCTACRAEFERRCQEERERDAAKQRKWYAERKARRARWKRPTPCAVFGKDINGKRKDARFCSGACRQHAHRTALSASAPSMDATVAASSSPTSAICRCSVKQGKGRPR